VTVPVIPTRGAWRVLRGALLAGTSSSLAVAAHAIGGGMLPDTGLTLLLTLGVGAAGTALANRRAGPRAVLLALGLSHLGIHLLLSLGEPGGAMDGWAMLGGHVAAVLLAAALLTRAESALFALAAAWAMLLPRWLTGPLISSAEPVPAPPRARPATEGALGVLLRRACARRGPPAFAWR
jgi:hypothetical protein